MKKPVLVSLVLGCLSQLVLGQVPPWPSGGLLTVANSINSHNPSISANVDGSFVVLWSGSSTADSRGVLAQRFDSEAAPAGGTIQVNTTLDGNQRDPGLAMYGDGSFIAVWESLVDDFPTDLETILLRRFSASDVPLTGEIRVDTLASGAKLDPVIGMASNGAFVVIWESEGSAGTDGSGFSIQGRMFFADATPDGGEFQVNTETAGDQVDPDIAMTPDGDFVVSWTSNAVSDSTIKSQAFLSDGSPSGGETEISPASPGNDFISSGVGVDVTGALTYVAVSEPDVEGFGRRYGSDGSDLGFFHIWNGVYTPQVAVGTDGTQFVIWTNFAGGGAWGKVWKANGEVLHDDFALPSQIDQGFSPDISAGPNGSFFAVWVDSSVEIQKYLGPMILEDGFESGDTTAWAVE